MRMLKSLPSSSLQSLGIQLQMDIPAQATHLPVGGRLMHFVTNWQKITKDPWVLEAIEGYKIEFHSEPAQGKPPGPVCLDQEQTQAMTQEIQELQKKGAISQVDNSLKGFVSQIFLVPKPDSAWRPVINLKSLNRYVIPHHFKMESIRTIKGVLQKDDWLIKLDLKDAYLTIPIAQTQRPLLRFSWDKEMWEFKVLPFGLSSAPWVFTKVTKPISSVLRRLGIRLILYLDDMLIMSQSQIEASSNLATVMTLLVGLGFIINLKKSVLSPTQRLDFLGFTLDSQKMTISLPQDKMHAIKKQANRILNKGKTTAHELAHLLGTMVAAHPAILPAPLYYRHLEAAKIRTIQMEGTYCAEIPQLSPKMVEELMWWASSAQQSNGRPLQVERWDRTICSDASKMGWGASCNGQNTGGPWTPEESALHINYLELKAAFFALRSLVPKMRDACILLRLDNVTAIAFLNRMGGTHSQDLSDLAVETWKWCIRRNIFIHAEHLPGKENVEADWESRHIHDSSDWKLNRQIFRELENQLGPFSIDLFASRTNTQLEAYCSWRPDPFAVAVDALSIPWTGHFPYLFPPFTLISRCLNKIKEEQASGVLVAPLWPSQVWFPLLLRSLVNIPVLLPQTQDILRGPDGRNHPMSLQGHLPLVAWPVSGNPSDLRDFQMELSACSESHGGTLQSLHTQVPGDSGIVGVSNGISIPSRPL